MYNLLKIEWIKLKYYRTFWVLLVFFLISLIALNIFAYNLYNNNRMIAFGEIKAASAFSFPYVWQTVSYLSGFLLVIPALLIITLTTNEITFRTQRQNIIDGVSRIQFIHTKILLVIILSLIFTVSVGICTLFFGIYEKRLMNFDNAIYLFYFFLQCVSYINLALLFGLYIKKAGFAISSFILYAWVIEKSVAGILNITFKNHIGNYLPLNTSDKLIPLPILKNVSTQFTEAGSISVSFLVLGIYLIGFYYLATIKIRNEDL